MTDLHCFSMSLQNCLTQYSQTFLRGMASYNLRNFPKETKNKAPFMLSRFVDVSKEILLMI